MTADDSLGRVEDYLRREREILLSGRLDDLEGLAETRDSVLSALGRADGDLERVERLKGLARRNGSLLRAAAEGVNRAMKRLADLRKAAGPIGSYSATGGRCEIGSVNPQFERKA